MSDSTNGRGVTSRLGRFRANSSGRALLRALAFLPTSAMILVLVAILWDRNASLFPLNPYETGYRAALLLLALGVHALIAVALYGEWRKWQTARSTGESAETEGTA